MSIIRKSYTVEFKTKVVREILREEKTLSQIASEYGTHTNVISRWRDQALAALPGAFNDQAASDQAAKEAAWEKEREELYAEIGKLSTQLAWMKKNRQCKSYVPEKETSQRVSSVLRKTSRLWRKRKIASRSL
jgi:transposase